MIQRDLIQLKHMTYLMSAYTVCSVQSVLYVRQFSFNKFWRITTTMNTLLQGLYQQYNSIVIVVIGGGEGEGVIAAAVELWAQKPAESIHAPHITSIRHAHICTYTHISNIGSLPTMTPIKQTNQSLKGLFLIHFLCH